VSLHGGGASATNGSGYRGLGGTTWLPAGSRRRGEVDGEVVEDGVDDGDWNGSSEILMQTVSSGW
jgi:hypothetical protein